MARPSARAMEGSITKRRVATGLLPEMAPPSADRRLGPIIIIAATALLLAFTWLGARDAMRAHRMEAEARVAAEIDTRALSLEEQLRGEFLAIDQTLRILALEWRRDPERFDLTTWRRDAGGGSPPSLPVFVTDAAGVVRASTIPGLMQDNVASQDYFRAAMANAANADEVAIGAPRQGPLAHQWQLTLARRLSRPDGSFAGVIAATLNTGTLAAAYRSLDVGPNDVIALLSIPGARLYPLLGGVGSDADSSIAGTTQAATIEAAPGGTWTGALGPDDIQRVVAVHSIPGRGLAILFGVDRQEAMGPAAAWERDVWVFAGAASALLLGVAGLLLRLNALAARREAMLASERTTLAAKTAQLEATLGGMSDGIMMLDADLRLLAWNQRFPDFTGVPPDMLRVGMPMKEILRAQAEAGEFGAVDVEAEVTRRMALLRAGGSIGSIRRLRPGGRVLELRRNPLAGGGFVTLYTDVTARHQAEERLQQAQKMAAVGRLTAGVAHDFNNLLATIQGSIDLMQRQAAGNPALTRRLAVMQQTIERGSGLVRQLLAFARKQPLEPAVVDLNRIVRGMTDLLRPTLGRSIRVETRLTDALWPALVDPVQVEHVILNLAINARDAMPEGGVLTIATANLILAEPGAGPELGAGEYVTVVLTDTGTGMTPEVLQNVFEPFFTTKAPGRGSGLGLSQVYGVARQSGGGVHIDSAVGRGTTVTVFLPRSEADTLQPPSQVSEPCELPLEQRLQAS